MSLGTEQALCTNDESPGSVLASNHAHTPNLFPYLSTNDESPPVLPSIQLLLSKHRYQEFFQFQAMLAKLHFTGTERDSF